MNKEKTLIIVGINSGIGSKIFTNNKKKYKLIIGTYNKNKPDIESNNLILQKFDFSNQSQIIKFSNYIEELNINNIDYINTIAIAIDKLIVDISFDDFEQMISVNIKQNFFIVKSLIKKMINDRYGRIIHLTSSKALKGDTGSTLYSLSKSSILGFSRSLAKEYSRFNITSNVISLGFFQTNLWDRLAEEKQKALLNETFIKKVGNIDNVLNSFNYLIDSPYITGSVLNVDGGLT